MLLVPGRIPSVKTKMKEKRMTLANSGTEVEMMQMKLRTLSRREVSFIPERIPKVRARGTTMAMVIPARMAVMPR